MAKITCLVPSDYFELADMWPIDYIEVKMLSAWEPETIIETAQESQCLLCPAPYPNIDESIISRLPNLKLIQTAGAGYNAVDTDAAAKAGVAVCNTPGKNATSVAEFVFGSIMVLQRRLIEADSEIKANKFNEIRKKLMAGKLYEIGGSKLGLLGMGKIGKAVARLGKAFGSDLYYYNIRRKTDIEEELELEFCEFEHLIMACDIISLHMPLTEETNGMVDSDFLSKVKPGAIIVNTTRGGMVVEDAIAQALAEGKIAGYIADVFENEASDGDSPLFHLPNELKDRMVLYPHLAGVTTPSFARILQTCLDNCERVIRGENPLHVVNGVNLSRSN